MAELHNLISLYNKHVSMRWPLLYLYITLTLWVVAWSGVAKARKISLVILLCCVLARVWLIAIKTMIGLMRINSLLKGPYVDAL